MQANCTQTHESIRRTQAAEFEEEKKCPQSECSNARCTPSSPDADKSLSARTGDPGPVGRCTGSHTQGEWAERGCRPPSPGLPARGTFAPDRETLLSRLDGRFGVTRQAPQPPQSQPFHLPQPGWRRPGEGGPGKVLFAPLFVFFVRRPILREGGVESACLNPNWTLNGAPKVEERKGSYFAPFHLS